MEMLKKGEGNTLIYAFQQFNMYLPSHDPNSNNYSSLLLLILGRICGFNILSVNPISFAIQDYHIPRSCSIWCVQT
jgi:hypothetical protein